MSDYNAMLAKYGAMTPQQAMERIEYLNTLNHNQAERIAELEAGEQELRMASYNIMQRDAARIAELEAERANLMRKWAIETDDSLTKCVERSINEWAERFRKATAERADYTCTPLVTERDAIVAVEQATQWRLAVDQLLSGWYSTADSYATPHEAIKALIAFEVTAALDPSVSSDAAALVEQGRQEAFKEAAAIRLLPPPSGGAFSSQYGEGWDDAVAAYAADIKARGEGK